MNPAIGATLVSFALITGVSAQERQALPLVFPKASDGRHVLAVDLHNHSVFSDGYVWPSIRVEEAKRAGLAAMAVTEHVEVGLRALDADAAIPDRNTAYRMARKWAEPDLIIIPGAELTRGMPPGHVNALFLSDANALAVDPRDAALSTPEDRAAYFASAAARERSIEAIEKAHSQGAFLVWNHPGSIDGSPDGRAHLGDMHRDLIRRGMLQGIEVANGQRIFDGAMQIALDQNLAIIGTTDAHGLVDWDLQPGGLNGRPGFGPPHRTSTLVLASSATLDGIRKALFSRASIALVDNTLYGREPDVALVVTGALSVHRRGHYVVRGHKTAVYQVALRNEAPIPFLLRVRDEAAFYDSGPLLYIPARAEILLGIDAMPAAEALKTLSFDVLNVYTAPRQNLALTLRPEPCVACPTVATGGGADLLSVPNGTPRPR